MLVELTHEQVNALRYLKEGIDHVDRYQPVPSDDEAIYLVPEDSECLHEFAYTHGQVTLGHLRDLTTILKESK